MPRGIPSKSTVKPPTIRERALEENNAPGSTTPLPLTIENLEKAIAAMPAGEPIGIHPTYAIIKPLVTIRLRRVGPIITDSQHTVSIPSPAFVKEGDRVLVAIYSTVGDWDPVEPRMP
jgi:hypothetical protein